MTEKERMEQGSIYNPNVSELTDEQSIYMEKLWEFNQLRPSEQDKKQKYMKEVFAECGEDCFIELPFRANWGGKNLHFGNRVYANFNLTVVDDGEIFVGDKVMFGPNVTIATANHPIDPSLREDAMQYNKSVHIGENVWVGAGVHINQGVTIGDNTIIGSGSVITKDIPANVVAAGVPCKVIREITEADKTGYRP